MTAIVENNYMKALEQILESQFDPKSKQMRDFKDALMKSPISNLFFALQGASAKVVKQEAKEEKKRGRKKKADDGTPKKKRTPNPYMLFLSDKRKEIGTLLLEENPALKGKELQNAITKKAGEIWKASSEEDKKPYVEKSAEMKKAGGVQNTENHPDVPELSDHEETEDEKEEPKAEEDEPTSAGRTYLKEHKVWMDEDSKLYYADNDEDSAPIGQITKGKPVAFKKS